MDTASRNSLNVMIFSSWKHQGGCLPEWAVIRNCVVYIFKFLEDRTTCVKLFYIKLNSICMQMERAMMVIYEQAARILFSNRWEEAVSRSYTYIDKDIIVLKSAASEYYIKGRLKKYKF